MSVDRQASQLVEVPFMGQRIQAMRTKGSFAVALKRMCDNMGIGYGSQYNRLKRRQWATIFIMKTVGADGKPREMVMVDRRTMIMWLATISTNKVKNPEARRLIVAYQRKCADVLDAYFAEGAAVDTHNPKASASVASTLLGDPDFAIKVFEEIKGLRSDLAEKQRQLESQRPDVEFAREIGATEGGIGVGQMAALLTKNGQTITQNQLFRRLRERGLLNAQRGRNRNLPTKAGQATGWFTTVAQHYFANGERNECLRTLVTPLGQRELLARIPQPALELEGETGGER